MRKEQGFIVWSAHQVVFVHFAQSGLEKRPEANNLNETYKLGGFWNFFFSYVSLLDYWW